MLLTAKLLTTPDDRVHCCLASFLTCPATPGRLLFRSQSDMQDIICSVSKSPSCAVTSAIIYDASSLTSEVVSAEQS